MLRYKISSLRCFLFRSGKNHAARFRGSRFFYFSLVPSPVPRFFRKFFFKIQRLRANLSHRFVLPLRITVFLNFSLTLIPKLRRKISVFQKNSVFLLLCRKKPFRRAAFCTDRSLCREARRKGSHFFTAYFSVCLTFFHRHKLRLIHQRMLKPDGSGIRTFHHAASAVITFSRKHHHRRSALF